ncbi:MAG: dihydropteroate synthase [Phycisphaerae bacterium]|jgi:dihydropteroate synthase
MTRILGILNITRDSFSDGGRYLTPDAAWQHAQRLIADGADAIDIGAESTHPDAEDVDADEELARLTPVLTQLKVAGVAVSVDTCKPAVMRGVLKLGADYINDVAGLGTLEAVDAVRDSDARLILMHSTARGTRAERVAVDPATIVERIVAFFADRLESLERASIDRRRVILDPGMGFFLGDRPEASLAVLCDIDRLKSLGCPVLISTSRKSFIGALLGTDDQPRPVAERGAGTLATELWAAAHGADYLRTHNVRALRDALAIWQALERS